MVRSWTIALAVLLVPSGAFADPPFRFPEARCPHGELKYVRGVPVLMVDGSADEIGSAVGQLALKPGRRMADYPDDLLKSLYLSMLRKPLLTSGKAMVQHFPDDYRAEMEAMAAASEVKWENLVLGNTLFDLKKVIACSALMVEPARSHTGGALMARNLDYPHLGYAHEYTLVTIFRPKSAKHAFASVGFPGLVGCLSGLNDAGLAVAVLEVPLAKLGEKRYDGKGLPYALCYRRLLEDCSTIDEALAHLEKMKRTGLSSLAVADRNGCAVFEITPERIVVRRGKDGTCACTNHFVSKDLQPPAKVNIAATYDRFATLTRVGELNRKLDLADLQAGLDAASLPSLTMQSMIFECQALRVHLAFGQIPASQGEFKSVDVGALFRGHW
jgi:isopenicillin-N N-acyltransferase like protein